MAWVLLSLRRGEDRLWGSQVELAEEFERGINLLHSSAADENELLEEASALLASSQDEQEMADEGEKVEMAETSASLPCVC